MSEFCAEFPADYHRRIEAAADLYLAAHARFSGLDIRFDLVVVAPGRWPTHVVNAFF